MAATAVAWSHDGRKIAAGNGLGLCEVWEVSSGRKLVGVRIQTSEVSDLAWSLDDVRLASGGVNGHVDLWDPATGEQLLALEPGTAPIRHIRWSPDGRKLAAVSHDGVIKVWDATAGYELPRRDFWRHLSELRERKRFERLIDEQRWPQAADVLKRLIATRVQDAYEMYQLALLSLQLDDRAGYHDVCNRMLSTFADAGNPYWVTWACSLAPDAIEDWPKAVASAEKAAKADPKSPQNQNTFGAILYRAGRFDESLQRLTEADRLAQQPDGSDRPLPAYTWFFLAMSHHRLGHRGEATKWLDKAVEWTDKTIVEAEKGATDLPWNRRLTLKLLRNEAEALLKSAPAALAAPPSKPAAKEKEKTEKAK